MSADPNSSNLSPDLYKGNRQPLCQGCPLPAISNIAVVMPLLRWLTKGQKPGSTGPDTSWVVKPWESSLATLNLYFLICKMSMAVPALLPSQRWLNVKKSLRRWSGGVSLSCNVCTGCYDSSAGPALEVHYLQSLQWVPSGPLWQSCLLT